jgi:hypothetical protein
MPLTIIVIGFVAAAALIAVGLLLPKDLAAFPVGLGALAFLIASVLLWQDYLALALALLAGVLLLLVLWYARRQRRRQAVAKLAGRHGFHFIRRDPLNAERVLFRLLSSGDGRVLANVLWGTWRGVNIRAADYGYYVVKGLVFGVIKIKRWHRFSIVVVGLGLQVPWVGLGDEAWVHRLQGRDVEFELEDFNRRFRVQADDREFAYKLIDARMMHWMLQAPPGAAFEVRSDCALVSVPRLPVDALTQLFDLAAGFRERIPRMVRLQYPDGV